MYPRLQVSVLLLGTLMCLPSLAPAQFTSQRPRGSVPPGATLAPPAMAPQGLRQTSALPTVIALSWDAVPGATGYHVLRSATANGPWLDRTPTPVQSPGYFFGDGGLLPSHSVWYRVSALHPDGSSGMSGPVLMTTAAAPPLVNVMATSVKPNPRLIECHAQLSWTVDSLARGYYVFRDNKVLTPRPIPASTVRYSDPLPPLSGVYEYFVVQLYEANDFPARRSSLRRLERAALSPPSSRNSPRVRRRSMRSFPYPGGLVMSEWGRPRRRHGGASCGREIRARGKLRRPMEQTLGAGTRLTMHVTYGGGGVGRVSTMHCHPECRNALVWYNGRPARRFEITSTLFRQVERLP